MNKLKLFLTFDHELPLGGLNTNYEKALFDQTRRAMDLADELQVKVTLFTDILCAIRFKEWDFENFYLPYVNQLKHALSKGHDVQLHLHPHWLTSEFRDGTYIPSTDFKLADFESKEYPYNIAGIIEKGSLFLKEVLKDGFPDYNCIAYRAGGYNLSPCSDTIFTELIKNGILYDSSICKGFYFKSAISEVDFRRTPSEPNWYIGSDGNYRRCSKSGILEIPVAGKPKTLFEIPTTLKLKKYRYRMPENHGKLIHEGKPAGFSYKIKQALAARILTFDNHTYSSSYLMKILAYQMRRYSRYDKFMVSVNSHPKGMGEYSFLLMKNFVEQTRIKYGENVEFYTYHQLYNESLNN
jgi:hypothetical protein